MENEFKIIIDEGRQINIEHNVGTLNVTTMNCVDVDNFEGVDLMLSNEVQLELVKALLPKILERGDLDKSIKTWIEQNMLDGDPMDDCGGCVAHMKPNDMYELVYDCVNGIMEN